MTAANGSLPLLAPMSEVAGRMAPQVGAAALENAAGGKGILLGGVAGVAPAKVVILGAGVAGTNATHVALGMGADVTLVDNSIDRSAPRHRHLRRAHQDGPLEQGYCGRSRHRRRSRHIHGSGAGRRYAEADQPRTDRRHAEGFRFRRRRHRPGGASETSRATTHSDPTYIESGVVHYCVANMPGGVARTSTFALNNATLPFALALANKGWKQACKDDIHLAHGLNVHAGKITYKAVSDALGPCPTSIRPRRSPDAGHGRYEKGRSGKPFRPLSCSPIWIVAEPVTQRVSTVTTSTWLDHRNWSTGVTLSM